MTFDLDIWQEVLRRAFLGVPHSWERDFYWDWDVSLDLRETQEKESVIS